MGTSAKISAFGSILLLACLSGCASEEGAEEGASSEDSVIASGKGDVVSWNLCGAAKTCDNGDWPVRHTRQLAEVTKHGQEGVKVIALTEFCSNWESDFSKALTGLGYTVAMHKMTKANGSPAMCHGGQGQQSNFLAVLGRGIKTVQKMYAARSAEHRGITCIDVGRFRGCVTHLEVDSGSVRQAQRREAKNLGELDNQATIIAGDFNEKIDRSDESWGQLWVSGNYACGLDWALIENQYFERAADTTRVRADTDHGSCYARGHFRVR